jgi:putative addiction module component (TIGR02574 family)
MEQDLSIILRQALSLPPAMRAALAGSLIDSLDDVPDETAEAAWAEEIQKRLDEIRSGRVRLVPWPEARIRIAGQ